MKGIRTGWSTRGPCIARKVHETVPVTRAARFEDLRSELSTVQRYHQPLRRHLERLSSILSAVGAAGDTEPLPRAAALKVRSRMQSRSRRVQPSEPRAALATPGCGRDSHSSPGPLRGVCVSGAATTPWAPRPEPPRRRGGGLPLRGHRCQRRSRRGPPPERGAEPHRLRWTVVAHVAANPRLSTSGAS